MNILASYEWMKEYLKTDLAPSEFARLTTNAGNSVEHMHDLARTYDKMVVGMVKSVEKHPNADKLRLAKTDIGGQVVEIVCGGVNLAEGQTVIVALPGAWVRWHGEGEPIELKETAIRGVKSFGMICAAEEVGFEKLLQPEHGIWDISALTDAKPGTPIAKALGLEDVLFDIEVTTNRPDCASIVGQAREGAVVTDGTFTWKPTAMPNAGTGHTLSVSVEAPELCPRYQAVVIDQVKVGPSPWWLQKRLLLSGHRPINNVVDVTNYVLHELGSPLHAFDYATLADGKIVVRPAKKGEKIKALDGNEYALTTDMLVIADATHPVAIAGVMGGALTGTGEGTTTIVLEAAVFDPVSVRRTSRALNLASDSSKLFEKGLSTESTSAALARATELICELAGGKVASAVVDERASAYKPLVFPFDPVRAQSLIGVEIPEQRMVEILEGLGFKLTHDSSHRSSTSYVVTVPYWRDHDIEASVDFVEEVARVWGYDKLPSVIPDGTLPIAAEDPHIVWERAIKESLRGAGFSEAYSYAFVSDTQLEQAGIDPAACVKILNPLSSDQSHIRPSLVPSMLTTVEANQRTVSHLELFELAPITVQHEGDLPKQSLRLLLCVADADGERAFLRAKGAVERLFRETGIHRYRLERGADATWHPSRSAKIWVGDHEHVGVVGELAPSIARAFGLEPRVVLVDLNVEALLTMFTKAKTYRPLPLFPEVRRDLAFVVARETEFAAVDQALSAVNPLVAGVELFDVYAGKGIPLGQKSLAVHVTLRAADRTLSSEEADQVMADLRQVLEKRFSAMMRA